MARRARPRDVDGAIEDGADQALRARPGIGFCASVGQRADLRYSRIVVDQPALIVVRQGIKTLQSTRGQWTLNQGEAIAIAGGQTFDVTNRVSARGRYLAQWLVWDPSIIAHFVPLAGSARRLTEAAMLGHVDPPFATAFAQALDAIGDPQNIPDAVAAHRLTEVLVWLAHRGWYFGADDDITLTTRVRRLISAAPTDRWTSTRVAGHLAMSEATLRRRLALEGTSFADLLTDVRMGIALMLLQSTTQAVARIARDVGYESASRFAVRFRARFGFPPTAIRGHARDRFDSAQNHPKVTINDIRGGTL